MAKITDGSEWSKPLPQHKDGELISCVQGIWDERGRSTLKVAEVKGHATDEMVGDCRVRQEDKEGDTVADRVADIGHRRQLQYVSEARRRHKNVRNLWYSTVCDVH